MTTPGLVSVCVREYVTGKRLGSIPVKPDLLEAYERGNLVGFQWPEGIVRAGDFLDGGQIDQFEIADDTVIFLDRV